MKLTEIQIQQIDNRLKKDGVKYWDIRIEMLDYVVTDVENSLENGEELEKAITNSFISLGWKKNYIGGNFENVVHQRTTIAGKKNKKLFWKYLKDEFKKPKTILFFLSLAFILNFFIYSNFVAKVIMAVFIFTKLVLIAFYTVKYKITKSIQLNFAFQLATFSLTLFNLFIFLPRVFSENYTYNSEYLLKVLTFLIPLSFLGIKFFLREYKKVNEIYQKLISE